MAGMSTRTLQAQLGHRSPRSTARYANFPPNAQQRVVEALTPALPPHAPIRVNGQKERHLANLAKCLLLVGCGGAIRGLYTEVAVAFDVRLAA